MRLSVASASFSRAGSRIAYGFAVTIGALQRTSALFGTSGVPVWNFRGLFRDSDSEAGSPGLLKESVSVPFWNEIDGAWPSKARVAEKVAAPLRALGARETLARLFPAVTKPWYDPVPFEKGLSLLGTLAKSVPAAVLTFVPETGVFKLIESFLEGNPHENDQ